MKGIYRLIEFFGFLLLLSSCATLKSDFEKAKTNDSIESYEEFITQHPNTEFTSQVNVRLEELRWNRAKNINSSNVYKDYISKYPSGRFLDSAKIKLEESSYKESLYTNTVLCYKNFLSDFPNSKYTSDIEKNLAAAIEFENKLEKANSITELENLINDYQEFRFSSKIIPKLENILIKDVGEKHDSTRFCISSLKVSSPYFEKSKLCYCGEGSLPINSEMKNRDGEGVVLDVILPVAPGSLGNLSTGTQKILVDFGSKKMTMTLPSTFTTSSPYTQVTKSGFEEFSFFPGAIWRSIPLLVNENKLVSNNGVAITDAIRIGSLYPGDGNIVIDCIEQKGNYIYSPGCTIGSVFRFIGKIKIGDINFIGENDILHPLTFLLSKDGFIYLRGTGKVIFSNGTEKDF